jgi:hypothetical protein
MSWSRSTVEGLCAGEVVSAEQRAVARVEVARDQEEAAARVLARGELVQAREAREERVRLRVRHVGVVVGQPAQEEGGLALGDRLHLELRVEREPCDAVRLGALLLVALEHHADEDLLGAQLGDVHAERDAPVQPQTREHRRRVLGEVHRRRQLGDLAHGRVGGGVGVQGRDGRELGLRGHAQGLPRLLGRGGGDADAQLEVARGLEPRLRGRVGRGEGGRLVVLVAHGELPLLHQVLCARAVVLRALLGQGVCVHGCGVPVHAL